MLIIIINIFWHLKKILSKSKELVANWPLKKKNLTWRAVGGHFMTFIYVFLIRGHCEVNAIGEGTFPDAFLKWASILNSSVSVVCKAITLKQMRR